MMSVFIIHIFIKIIVFKIFFEVLIVPLLSFIYNETLTANFNVFHM